MCPSSHFLRRNPGWDSRRCAGKAFLSSALVGIVVSVAVTNGDCLHAQTLQLEPQQAQQSLQPQQATGRADQANVATDAALASDAGKVQDATAVPEAAKKEYRPIDLAAVEQLVLVLSNSTDEIGKNRQEVLVFLGRSKNRGWERIGDENPEELAEHWRGVAQRHIAAYREAGLTSEQIEKVNLAVEVSIVEFQRLYRELRTDFLDQPDQKSRLAVLASDSRYERLRQLGREGLFREQSLVAKVIHKALNETTQVEALRSEAVPGETVRGETVRGETFKR